MNKLTMSAEHLQRIFEVTRCAISKDNAREAFQYTKVTLNGDSLIAEALDGYKLIRFSLKTDKCNSVNMSFCKSKEGLDDKKPILLTHLSDTETIEAIVLPLRK